MADSGPPQPEPLSGAGQIAHEISPRDNVNSIEQGCAQRAGLTNQSRPTHHNPPRGPRAGPFRAFLRIVLCGPRGRLFIDRWVD